MVLEIARFWSILRLSNGQEACLTNHLLSMYNKSCPKAAPGCICWVSGNHSATWSHMWYMIAWVGFLNFPLHMAFCSQNRQLVISNSAMTSSRFCGRTRQGSWRWYFHRARPQQTIRSARSRAFPFRRGWELMRRIFLGCLRLAFACPMFFTWS